MACFHSLGAFLRSAEEDVDVLAVGQDLVRRQKS